jgi:hypothetical protein
MTIKIPPSQYYATVTNLLNDIILFSYNNCNKSNWCPSKPANIRCGTVNIILIPEHKFLFWTVHIEDLYCFHYTSSTEDIPKPAGWNFFDLQSEYQRMRVPSDQWSLTLLNKDYEVRIT